jgi:hypothetical protein
MTHTKPFQKPNAPSVSCAAARGSTTRGTAAPPTGTGTSPTIAGTTWAFAWPQLTRGLDGPWLTRFLKLAGQCARQESLPPGFGRVAGWPWPKNPGGNFFFCV